MAVEQTSVDSPMEAFYRQLQTKALDALWRHTGPPQPSEADARPPYDPCLWRWRDINPLLDRAAELVQPSHEDQRRALTLKNPSIKPVPVTTHTVSGAVQMVLPGEIAPAHRHTPAAIRFIMRGKGAVTFVNG